MTQDEIIEMANKAELCQCIWIDDEGPEIASLVTFSKLVAEKERVACWNILFDYAGRDDLTLENESLLKHLAGLIEARGEA